MAEDGFPWDPNSYEIARLVSPTPAVVEDALPSSESYPRRTKGAISTTGAPSSEKSLRACSHRLSTAQGGNTLKPQSQPSGNDLGLGTQSMVRTVPPWVRSVEADDLIPESTPNSPASAHVAQHNHSPSETTKSPYVGDSECEHETSPFIYQPHPSRWVTFAEASAYPRENFTGEKVTPEWLNKHHGDYSMPWLAGHNEDDMVDNTSRYHAFRRKREVWYKRMQSTILRNPFIPLVIRFIIFFFATMALALGASIFRIAAGTSIRSGPSAEMAIIVDAVALVYILGITYDEYLGKPLGLRSASAKLRIVLLDLFFIVFESANLSLAMQSLSYPNEGCSVADEDSDTTNGGICPRQEALAAVLLVALIAWLFTFSVSLLRLVERVVPG